MIFENIEKASIDASKSTLTIVHEGNGLAFFVSDLAGVMLHHEKQNFSSQVSPSDSLVKIVSNNIYSGKFAKTKLVLKSQRISIFPSKYKLNNDNYGLLDFEFDGKTETVMENKIADFAFSYFPVDLTFHQTAIGFWPNLEVYHHETLFFEQCFFNSTKDLGQLYFLNIKEKYFSAFISENGKVKITNNFRFEGKDDFGFFALGLLHNLGLDQNILLMKVTGNIVPESVLFQMLEKYILNVSIENSDQFPAHLAQDTILLNYIRSAHN